MHQKLFGSRAQTGPAEKLTCTALPRSSSWIKVEPSGGGGGKGKGQEREGWERKQEEERRGKGRGASLHGSF